MIRLGVNIDHVATLRQARRERFPEPIAAAHAAVLGGADLITLHLREDRRHVQDRDVEMIREGLAVGVNLEMAASDEMIAIACHSRPHQVTLVPEKPEELTTEGGLDVLSHLPRLVAGAVTRLAAGPTAVMRVPSTHTSPETTSRRSFIVRIVAWRMIREGMARRVSPRPATRA